MLHFAHPLIAFTGFGHSGKDEAAKPLIAAGYTRCCFGDIIKAQCDPLIREHLGFSAFTSDPKQKAQIRQTLQYWGEDNYDNIFTQFFRDLKAPAVNTRLCRLREAHEWVQRGGIIVRVVRPGVTAETSWAREMDEAMVDSKLAHSILINTGTIEDLHALVTRLFLGIVE